MIEIEAIRLSSLCDFNADYASPLKNEASGREYWRVGNKKESFVLCYLDPDIGDHSDFINISESLKSNDINCLLYTSPSPRDGLLSRMPSSA